MVSFPNKLTEEMRQKIFEHQASFNLISGVVILHDIRDWSIVFMSERGLNDLKISEEELYSMTNEVYHARFFNADDAADYVPKISALMQKNSDTATVSFYQQLKFPDSPQWRWHLSSIRIFMRDDDGKPLITITISIPVDAMHHMAAKADRLLEENNFLRNNYTNFSKLSKREQTILREIALGKSSIEIADELCISPTTVDTHRRNIREKLNTKSSFEISKYARAFDLI
ncbi:helix-turn-helix transcriptional regulator [Pedobacter paludis]|uniref:LuxR family transcriptional regulator n=1 Tax=Pedobacter paludis TaxID=2203212 RepID=A0A317F2H2_9SPHI|nr:LuxR C-terminal-related transcriptional regulator [Pedobacter paludis]PWS32029.1 LuxR family transcriptional regulator [Pedobacter paludis]